MPYTAEYTVHYMLKNLTGDDYTEIQSVTNHGVLGSTVRSQVLSYMIMLLLKKTKRQNWLIGQNLYMFITHATATLSL